MDTMLMASIGVLGVNLAIAGIVITFWMRFSESHEATQRSIAAALESDPTYVESVEDLNRRLTKLERTLGDITEEIETRIDRGNKIWRQIRARERREEESGEDEGYDEEDGDVLQVDAFGSGAEGMRGVSAHLEADTPGYEQVRKALAMRKAGLG